MASSYFDKIDWSNTIPEALEIKIDVAVRAGNIKELEVLLAPYISGETSPLRMNCRHLHCLTAKSVLCAWLPKTALQNRQPETALWLMDHGFPSFLCSPVLAADDKDIDLMRELHKRGGKWCDVLDASRVTFTNDLSFIQVAFEDLACPWTCEAHEVAVLYCSDACLAWIHEKVKTFQLYQIQNGFPSKPEESNESVQQPEMLRTPSYGRHCHEKSILRLDPDTGDYDMKRFLWAAEETELPFASSAFWSGLLGSPSTYASYTPPKWIPFRTRVIQWCLDHSFRLDSYALGHAIGFTDLINGIHLRGILLDRGCVVNEFVLMCVANLRDLDYLKDLYNLCMSSNTDTTKALLSGSIITEIGASGEDGVEEIIIWLLSVGCPKTVQVIHHAITHYATFRRLEWLRQQGFPLDSACYVVLSNRYKNKHDTVKVFDWLYEHGAPLLPCLEDHIDLNRPYAGVLLTLTKEKLQQEAKKDALEAKYSAINEEMYKTNRLLVETLGFSHDPLLRGTTTIGCEDERRCLALYSFVDPPRCLDSVFKNLATHPGSALSSIGYVYQRVRDRSLYADSDDDSVRSESDSNSDEEYTPICLTERYLDYHADDEDGSRYVLPLSGVKVRVAYTSLK